MQNLWWYCVSWKTKFRLWFNNCKSKHRSVRKGKQNVQQRRFHSHYVEECYIGIDDSEITLFGKCEIHKQPKINFNPMAAKNLPPPPSYQFSPLTSTNVGISPQSLLTFSFNSFSTLVWNFKFLPSASPKLLDLSQGHLSKKAVFLVKSL